MPALNFLLTNPRLTLGAKKDSEEWTLGFDAQIERPEGFLESFTIFCDGEEYDGYSMQKHGVVSIKQRTSKNKSQESSLAEPNDKKLTEEIFEHRPGFIAVDYIPPDMQDGEKLPPCFRIELSLPADTFFRVLQAKPETCVIHLWVSTLFKTGREEQEEGFVYGEDPDGKELVWRREKKNYALLDFMRLTIEPRPGGILGSELSSKEEQQKLPASTPGLVNKSDLP